MGSQGRAGRRRLVRWGLWQRGVAGGAVLGLVLAGCSGSEGDPSADRASSGTTSIDGPSDSIPAAIDGRLEVDGRQRSYRLVVPSSVTTNEPVPLVLIMHGNGTDAAGIAEKTGFDAVAEREGFLAVYPEVADEAGVWNGGYSHRADGVDDVAFLTAVVEQVAQDYAVDPDRVFATGLSGGGMMSYRLACESPDLVAAIAPIAATMVGDCEPAGAVSVLHVHGTEDRGIPYAGREERRFPPVREVLDAWGAAGGCDREPDESTEGLVTTTTWVACDPRIGVELLLLEGTGHEYPRSELGAPIDGPSVVWDFFSTHPRVR